MPSISLEERVERLERIVDKMRSDLLPESGHDGWETAIASLSSDLLAMEILDEALQSREKERQRPLV